MDQRRLDFPDTMWTLVDQAAGRRDVDPRHALGRFMEVYWPPVYSFLRRSGLGREEADECTQAFFADVVLGRRLLDGTDRTKGRLRSLLFAAASNFLADHARRKHARAKHTASAGRSLDREESRLEKMGDVDARAAFERGWACAVVEEALARCEKHYRASGKEGHWRLFEARVVRPSVASVEAPALVDVATPLGFRTPADAAAAVQVVKKRFGALLREVIQETTSGAEEAEFEYREVIKMFE